jgi:molybdopterin-containing oxidoreductase family iron-sulfur binding subunit
MKKDRSKRNNLNDPDQYNGNNTGEGGLMELLDEKLLKANSSRRSFLKLVGYSFASAAVIAACKRPVQMAIPYAVQPPEITPGAALFYATTYFDGQEYCSILVKTRDGRPIKIEGNGLSEYNAEGTTARVQASVLSLYDDARLKYPEIENKKTTWDSIDKEITNDLSQVNKGEGEVVLLTSSIISPTTIKLIQKFGSGFRKFRWVQYDPISCSAILDANRATFGKAVVPDYNFNKANLVLSVNADFLGTWIAPVHFIPKYVSRRKLNNGSMEMLKHVHYETGYTITGANADVRRKIKPSEEKSFFSTLHNIIAKEKGSEAIPRKAFPGDVSALAKSLLAAAGKSIVIAGSNDTEVQLIVNAINYMLGNYGECIDISSYISSATGSDSEMDKLVNDLNDGKISALLMHNVNPLYDYHESETFAAGLKKTRISVNMASSLNETVGEARYECPVNHFLESWNDYEITPGQLSLAQPCINTLFDTRSFQDSLLKWSGESISWHDYLAASWEKEYFPASGEKDFRNFWNRCVGRGIYNYKLKEKPSLTYDGKALKTIASNHGVTVADSYEIMLYPNIAMGNGMHSNNPWLMELPDPITRQCWENVASISPADAAKLGVVTGQVIKLNDKISVPAYIQQGQTEGTISVALGYGHTDCGPVANDNGVNMFPYVSYERGNRIYNFTITQPEVTSKQVTLGLIQLHDSMEGRAIARNTRLSEFKKNPISGNEKHEEFESMHKSLYPEWVYDGFHWGMAIDLNACVGCGTCVIACQAENNSPTVGKDQVSRNRIMQWIKVHRYFSDDPDDPKVLFQPVFCQHCDNAPCENVCPVSATNHSNEGLNQMAYNRCVGTKYCMNNCPYRVRRFNWYRFTNNKAFDYNTASDLGRMVLNPDVTVRERGVVEKCSFCVQRIQAKKLEAKLENRVLNDLEIKPACMQACPAGAIIFGNLNDKESAVSKLFTQERRYHLLEELHTLPSVGFLTKVWNDEGEV